MRTPEEIEAAIAERYRLIRVDDPYALQAKAFRAGVAFERGEERSYCLSCKGLIKRLPVVSQAICDHEWVHIQEDGLCIAFECPRTYARPNGARL